VVSDIEWCVVVFCGQWVVVVFADAETADTLFTSGKVEVQVSYILL